MADEKTVLIIEDDPEIRKVCVRLMKSASLTPVEAGTLEEARPFLTRGAVDVCLCDNQLPDGSGIAELGNLRRLSRNTEFIIMTGQGGVGEAVAAVKAGAFDFIPKPFDPIERVALTVKNALERKTLRDRADEAENRAAKREGFDAVIGRSPLMLKTIETARQAAESGSVSVLILGESGTGKEVLARAVHQSGPRSRGPFVVVNCGALPETLIESELFGHDKGSFTGAAKDKRGLFEEANKGTIFLDEIGEMPVDSQVRLLRVLQSGEIRRVGSAEPRHVDVRVLSATNADLKAGIKAGTFREDLYYRLNVLSLELPPLRSRRDDIPQLALHFLRGAAKRAAKTISGITDEAMRTLVSWNWPGNVRELENTIERAVVLCRGAEIEGVDLPEHLFVKADAAPQGVASAAAVKYAEAKDRVVNEFEKNYVAALLTMASGNMATAAEIAGLDRSNFRKVVVRSGVDFREFLPKRVR